MIEKALTAAFSPEHLLVKDQSHLHVGHVGARKGLGHFQVTIVAEVFQGLNRIECHRLVYKALGEMMLTDIHALTMRVSAKKPEPF